MADARGFYQENVLMFESTYGTNPFSSPGDSIKMPYVSSDMGSTENMIASEVINSGSPHETEPSFGHVDVSGDIVVPLDIRYSGYWLKALAVTPDTTDNLDGTYTHVFDPASSADAEIPSFTYEEGYPDVSEYKLFTGCKVGGCNINFELNQEMNMDLSVMGKDETASATAVDSAPSEPHTLNKFFAKGISIKIDGTTYNIATSMNLSIVPVLDSEVYTVSGNGFRHSLPLIGYEVTGSFNALFQNQDLYDKALANTVTDIEILCSRTIGGDTWTLSFDMQETLFPREKLQKSGKGTIYQPVSFRAFHSTGSNGYPLRITLFNDVASYA